MTKKKKKTKNVKHAAGQKAIDGLLYPNSINWPREMKIFYKLYEDYPDPEFWESLRLDFKLNSLAFLVTEAGNDIVKQKYNERHLKLPEKEVYELSPSKIGVDREIKRKPRSLKEFLEFAIGDE